MPGISDIKHQIEEETEIADGDIMTRILAHLGIAPVLVYEKRRRTWKFRDVEVVIDELPFGLYMEIEGSLTAIREAEMLIGADEFEAENETYPRLTARLGKPNGGIIESRFPQK
jgi:adenylate cyclase, class 2